MPPRPLPNVGNGGFATWTVSAWRERREAAHECWAGNRELHCAHVDTCTNALGDHWGYGEGSVCCRGRMFPASPARPGTQGGDHLVRMLGWLAYLREELYSRPEKKEEWVLRQMPGPRSRPQGWTSSTSSQSAPQQCWAQAGLLSPVFPCD